MIKAFTRILQMKNREIISCGFVAALVSFSAAAYSDESPAVSKKTEDQHQHARLSSGVKAGSAVLKTSAVATKKSTRFDAHAVKAQPVNKGSAVPLNKN